MKRSEIKVGTRVVVVKSGVTGVITQVDDDSFSVQWEGDLEYWYPSSQAEVVDIDTSGEQTRII